MPIFTSPKTLNDGTADHIMSFRAQLPDPKNVVGQWIEAAAAASTKSLLTIKHDDRGKIIRRLAQRTRLLALAADATVFKPVTINVTATYDPGHSITEVTKDVIIARAMLTDASFINNWLLGQI